MGGTRSSSSTRVESPIPTVQRERTLPSSLVDWDFVDFSQATYHLKVNDVEVKIEAQPIPPPIEWRDGNPKPRPALRIDFGVRRGSEGYFTSTRLGDTYSTENARIAVGVLQTVKYHLSKVPDGSLVRAGAYQLDGFGAERERVYQRLGFSAPLRNDVNSFKTGDMWARVQNGKLIPFVPDPEKWI